MCEADLSSADQVVIFKGDFAYLQAINLTNSTTWVEQSFTPYMLNPHGVEHPSRHNVSSEGFNVIRFWLLQLSLQKVSDILWVSQLLLQKQEKLLQRTTNRKKPKPELKQVNQ